MLVTDIYQGLGLYVPLPKHRDHIGPAGDDQGPPLVLRQHLQGLPGRQGLEVLLNLNSLSPMKIFKGIFHFIPHGRKAFLGVSILNGQGGVKAICGLKSPPFSPLFLQGNVWTGPGHGAAFCGRVSLGKNRRDDFADPFHHVRLVGHRLGHGGFAGAAGRDALRHKLAGVDQEAG